MRRAFERVVLAIAFAILAGASAGAADEDATRELAPTGKLRVAIAISPAPSAFWAVRDANGSPRGVTVALGRALAERLGVPLEIVVLASSGEIVKAADAGTWDVTFVPVDAERKKAIDFAAPYHLLRSTYLAAPHARVGSIAEANAAGVRILGVANTATFRASQAASPAATHTTVPAVEDAIALLKDGKAELVALSRESLGGLVDKLPGARVLDGAFLNSTTAIAVPKGKPAALAYAKAFIEEAKASGLVRKAFDEMGLKMSEVAPPGMAP